MERRYVVNTENFKGTAESTAHFDGKQWLVDYSGALYNNNGPDLTIEKYNEKKQTKFEILTWEEFEVKYYFPHLKSLQKPFVETTAERFEDALECLPPKRWTRHAGNEFFFMGECFTANLYDCYVRVGNKYFVGLRPIEIKPEEIFSTIPN